VSTRQEINFRIGQNLLFWRVERGKAQAEVALALKKSQAQVSRIENGVCGLSAAQVEILARLLSVDVADLFFAF
jgi:transcriptional regulator with XRE-family HTH domain